MEIKVLIMLFLQTFGKAQKMLFNNILNKVILKKEL